MDKHYLVKLNEDGLDVRQLTPMELMRMFKYGDLRVKEKDLQELFGTTEFYDKLPAKKEWGHGKLLLIKGNIVIPERIGVIKERG